MTRRKQKAAVAPSPFRPPSWVNSPPKALPGSTPAETRQRKAGARSGFAGEFGNPLSIPNLTYRYFRPILVAAVLPQIRLYDLRHSHATLLLGANEHIKIVSERLGHSTPRLTLDTYSHVLKSMQEKTSNTLEATLYTKNSTF